MANWGNFYAGLAMDTLNKFQRAQMQKREEARIAFKNRQRNLALQIQADNRKRQLSEEFKQLELQIAREIAEFSKVAAIMDGVNHLLDKQLAVLVNEGRAHISSVSGGDAFNEELKHRIATFNGTPYQACAMLKRDHLE